MSISEKDYFLFSILVHGNIEIENGDGSIIFDSVFYPENNGNHQRIRMTSEKCPETGDGFPKGDCPKCLSGTCIKA